MDLNKIVRILIGLATAWVTLYPVLFFAAWLTMFQSIAFTPATSRLEPPPFFSAFTLILPVHCLTILLYMALIVFYLIHVIRNTNASETIRIILGVGIFFLPFVAMPIYYYLYIGRDQPPIWARKESA